VCDCAVHVGWLFQLPVATSGYLSACPNPQMEMPLNLVSQICRKLVDKYKTEMMFDLFVK